MPIIFTINKPRQTLEQQWAHLVRRGQDGDRSAMKKYFVGLLIISGLYLLIYFLTPVDDFITFKVVVMVLVVLTWCTLVIVFLFYNLANLRRQWRLRRFLASITEKQLRYSVQIDDEKVAIFSPDFAYEFSWAEFGCYGIHNETLYVFNEVERSNSLYWNRSEMGGEAFAALLELLHSKSLKQVF